MKLELDGVLTAEQIAQTAQAIAAVQRPDGAIEWFVGGHLDVWDHTQAAMSLTAVGDFERSRSAFAWLAKEQRSDGSWPIRYDGDYISDSGSDANFCAYIATGMWHFWLITKDEDFVRSIWPVIDRAIDCVISMELAEGAIAWARDAEGTIYPAAHITSNASILLSLRCALALASSLGYERPRWHEVAQRLHHVLHHRREIFTDQSRHAMEWYYPVLGGSFAFSEERIEKRWDEFITEYGIRCVNDHDWVTGAETAELALALDAMGRREVAIDLLARVQHLREADGSYWTGLVLRDGKNWPVEKTTWTAATMILAVDAITRTTAGNGVFRGEHLPDVGGRDV